MNPTTANAVILAAAVVAASGCSSPAKDARPGDRPSAPAANALTPAERAAGWTLLFDGTDPSKQLRGFRRADFPKEWATEDGCIVLRGKGGDIVTREQYGDFEFTCDWKVAPGGNSGIMWHVSEDFGAPWETGPEMQVLDDERHGDGKSRLTSAGACYALYPAPTGAVNPAGEWNRATIRCVGPKVTYALNGVVTADFDMSSQDWKDRVKGSKFASMPAFGTKPSGHVALQDHGDVVMYRNLKIRPLGAQAAAARPAETR